MYFDSRIFVFWASNCLLFVLSRMINSELAPFSLYLILLGPMLVLPALYFKYPSLIFCSFITGLSVDSLLPQPFWIFVYAFPVIALLIRFIRSHFRTETSYRFILLAHIANLACIALLSIRQGIHFGELFASLNQLVAIILLSHVILHLVTPWFFDFENLLIRLLKVEHAYEDQFSQL